MEDSLSSEMSLPLRIQRRIKRKRGRGGKMLFRLVCFAHAKTCPDRRLWTDATGDGHRPRNWGDKRPLSLTKLTQQPV